MPFLLKSRKLAKIAVFLPLLAKTKTVLFYCYFSFFWFCVLKTVPLCKIFWWRSSTHWFFKFSFKILNLIQICVVYVVCGLKMSMSAAQPTRVITGAPAWTTMAATGANVQSFTSGGIAKQVSKFCERVECVFCCVRAGAIRIWKKNIPSCPFSRKAFRGLFTILLFFINTRT